MAGVAVLMTVGTAVTAAGEGRVARVVFVGDPPCARWRPCMRWAVAAVVDIVVVIFVTDAGIIVSVGASVGDVGRR